MDQVRLSVIVPGYNTKQEWWRRCLRSVLAAIGPEDEVICVDDGSATAVDETWLGIADTRLQIIRQSLNQGQSAARNLALNRARGEYVTFVDSDDEVMPSIYARCFETIARNASDICAFGVRVIWTKEGLYKDDLPSLDKVGALTRLEIKQLFTDSLLEYPVNKLYRRAFLVEHQIAFDEGICPGEDAIFNLKCLKAAASYAFVPEIGYVYYRYGGSSLSSYLPRYEESMRLKAAYWKDVVGEALQDRFSNRNNGGFVQVLRMLVRKLVYIRPVRRWRIRKLFPKAVSMAVEPVRTA